MIASRPHSQPPTPAPPRPPTLSAAHTSLLSIYIASRYSLAALTVQAKLSPADLLAFITNPAVQSRLADITTFTKTTLTLRAAQARHVAIEALESATLAAPDPIEKRRAATALLRATTAPLIPTDPPSSSDPDSPLPTPHSRPSSAPRPAITPRPDLTPRDVVDALLRALRNNNAPEPNSGLATAAAFADHDATINGETIPTDDPAESIEALEDTAITDLTTSAHGGRPTTVESSNSKAIITAPARINHALRHITFHLSRNPNSRHPNRWLFTSITTTTPTTPTPPTTPATTPTNST